MMRDALFALDRGLSALTGGRLIDRPALISFLFHKVFADRAEAAQELVSPAERATADDFRRLFDYFLDLDYRFVSSAAVLDGLDPARNHILLTFDDGYANNRRLLPVLKEYRIPATFFVATGFVGAETAFWWDAIYRARHREGTHATNRGRRRRALHTLSRADAEAHVRHTYGADALASVGELDRPMTEAELRAFAAEDLVTIGNHTVDHTRLTMLAPAQVDTQIAEAQAFLEAVTGARPRTIAYPYGDWSPAVVAAARAHGLELGLTCDARRDSLPLGPDDLFRLGRFAVFSDDAFLRRCRECRLDFSFSRVARSAVHRFR